MAVAEAPPEEITEDALSEWPYRFEIVPVGELAIDKDYQRGLTSFWQTVAEKFNPALVGTLIVSERGKKKNVVDGQTRLKAMTEIGKTAAPCLIYEGLSKKQEALLFSLLQTQRRNMTTYERFRAQLVAGEEMAIGISTIERMWRIDPEHLREILELVRDIWGVDNRDGVSAQILTGLSTFVRNQTSIDYDRLRKRLADVTPALIINRAAQIREGAGWGTGAGKSVSQAILAEYMRRR
jgi:hypothetical protein